jgi:phospho-N-acetylmuramoyl-pentapeptide-transferase
MVLFLGSLGYTAIGFWDDFCKIRYANNDLGLSPRQKFAAQSSVAWVVAVSLWGLYDHPLLTAVYVPGTFAWSGYYNIGWGYALWVWLVLTATSNAVNLTDGLDGLVSPMLMIVLLGFVMIHRCDQCRNNTLQHRSYLLSQ